MSNYHSLLIICLLALVILPSPAAAFGAGNIASVSTIEGHNWRHGDIEDMLKVVAFLRGLSYYYKSSGFECSSLILIQ